MANLIVNGDFSAGITNWNLSTPLATISATGGLGGTQCAQYTANNRRVQQNVTVVVGQQYDLSFWLRFQNNGMQVEVQIRDTTTNVLYLNGVASSISLGIWRNYVVSFTATRPVVSTTCSLRIRRTSGGGGTNVFLDDVSIIPFVVCYLGDSKISSRDSITGEVGERAASVISKDHEVYDVTNEKYVPVVSNMISGPVKSLWKIPANALGTNQPSEDFFITGGHKIIYNGEPTKVRLVKEAVRVSIPTSPVYSIVCEENTVIKVNNVPTVAFGRSEIDNMLCECATEQTE
jgi:hypothetical protein